MAIKWSTSIRMHNSVELQLGVPQDKNTIYLLTVPVEGNEAWLNWFDGEGNHQGGLQAPEDLPLAQQGFLQKEAELHDLNNR